MWGNKKIIFGVFGAIVLATVLGAVVWRTQNQKATVDRPKAAGSCTGTLQFYYDNTSDCRKPRNTDPCNAPCFWDDGNGGGSCRADGWTYCWCPRQPVVDCATLNLTTEAACLAKNNGVSVPGKKQTCQWSGGGGGGGGASYTATYPVAGTTNVSSTPTFTWTGRMPDNNNYQNICIGAWVSTSSCESVGCFSVTGKNSYTPTVSLSPNTTYGWTVYSAFNPGTKDVTNMSGGCQQFKTGEAGKISASGKVFVDTNKNGQIDSGEIGLSGRTVTITSWDRVTKYGEAVTDSSGNYKVDNLSWAQYRITHEIPAGYERTTDDSHGFDPTSQNIVWNFGLFGTDPATHLECVDNACAAVSGGGGNKDGCTTARASCGANEVNACWDNKGANGKCYDCDGNGVINVLDFSCFQKHWLKNVE